MDAYRLRLSEACQTIADSRKQLFAALINVGMSGEFKELDELFEEGDFFQFERSHFEGSNDINVEILMELLKKMDETHSKLVNLNVFK